MPLIIDGYNLLYAAGMVRASQGDDASFHAERMALLDALTAVIEDQELRQTVVVFDSAQAPPGLPRMFDYHGITVRFATGYDDADELIEELIRDHHAPRRLTVVSSDHRVQRAAKRRRAKAIDSDSWFRLMRQSRRRRQEQAAKLPPPAKRPAAAVPSSEVAQWMQFFGEVDVDALRPPEKVAGRPETPSVEPTQPQPPHSSAAEIPADSTKPATPQGPVFSEEYLRKIAEEFFGQEDS